MSELARKYFTDYLSCLNISSGLIIFTMGLALFIGYYVKIAVNKYKIPDVTGYVLLGVVSGMAILRHIPDLLDSLHIISDFALALIAFIVGHELRRDVIVKLGKAIFCIAFMEAFGAALLVFSVLYFLGIFPFHFALLCGAIASATAPAATVYVIHQYKSKGPLTSTILAVVGIDDAIALIIYVFASSVAANTFTGKPISFVNVIGKPLVLIILSLAIGTVSGWLFIRIYKNVRNQERMSMGIIAFLLLVMGICEISHVSELLAVMVFSAFITNLSPVLARRSEQIIDGFTPILIPLFFIFAGAHLDVGQIGSIAVACLIYTIARAAGKIVGASLGAIIGKAPGVVKKYTGLGLIPQIGVAVALAFAVKKQFGLENGPYGKEGAEMAFMIINLLLCSTVITESIGPILTRLALIKSGEVKAN